MINKFKLIRVVVLAMLIFTNCSSDDGDGSNGNETSGTWLLTNFQLNRSYDVNNDGNSNTNLLEEVSCNVQQRFIFDTDGTGRLLTQGEQIFLDDEEVNGTDQYLIECEPTDSSIAYLWSEEGNSIFLTQTFLGDTELVKAGNTLTFFLQDAFDMPIIENGELTGYEIIDVTFIYTKQ